MMIGTCMILAGMVMMIWPTSASAPALDVGAAGHNLREAFGGPTYEPLPDHIEQSSRRVARALRLVGRTE